MANFKGLSAWVYLMYLAGASARNISSSFSLFASNFQYSIHTITDVADLLIKVPISKTLTNASNCMIHVQHSQVYLSLVSTQTLI